MPAGAHRATLAVSEMGGLPDTTGRAIPSSPGSGRSTSPDGRARPPRAGSPFHVFLLLGQSQWVGHLAALVAELRSDLGVARAPFLTGELLHSGSCSAHNPLVAQMSRVPQAYFISARGLAGQDPFHFDLAGQRELGRRYRAAMLARSG